MCAPRRSRKEIGLYIHIPFCRAKCHYCDFNSYAGIEDLAPSYAEALKREMAFYSESLRNCTVKSVYIGGGTPSCIGAGLIRDILSCVRNTAFIEREAEVSLEANPGTLSYEKLMTYQEAGINRLSLGLQAWQDRLLGELGRIHTREDFVNNLLLAKKAGFANVNIDLIFSLPGQTLEDWRETVENVAGLEPAHISCYGLKIEEGTAFGERLEKGAIEETEDELDRKMYWHAVESLGRAGYKHYEISNFAAPGGECTHNLIYWKAGEYIGIGAGAHSYYKSRRYNNSPKVDDYLKALENRRPPMEDIQYIGSRESMSEFMILGLRLVDGVEPSEFRHRFGASLESAYGKAIEKLVRRGLLEYSAGRLKLSDCGLDLANQVFMEFI